MTNDDARSLRMTVRSGARSIRRRSQVVSGACVAALLLTLGSGASSVPAHGQPTTAMAPKAAEVTADNSNNNRLLTLKPLTATPVPTITGTAKPGSILTAKVGSWRPSPVTIRYAWFRSGTVIKGATAGTYKLVAADAGRKITVKVTGSRTGYSSVARTSTSLLVLRTFTWSPVPVISGTAKVGSTLTAKAGVWGPSPVVLRYAWFRDGFAINGATGANYKLAAADAGRAITAKVTGSRTGYAALTRVSKPLRVSVSVTGVPPTFQTGELYVPFAKCDGGFYAAHQVGWGGTSTAAASMDALGAQWSATVTGDTVYYYLCF